MIERYYLAGISDLLAATAAMCYLAAVIGKESLSRQQGAHSLGKAGVGDNIAGYVKVGIGGVRSSRKQLCEVIFSEPVIFTVYERLPALGHCIYAKTNGAYGACISYGEEVGSYLGRIV